MGMVCCGLGMEVAAGVPWEVPLACLGRSAGMCPPGCLRLARLGGALVCGHMAFDTRSGVVHVLGLSPLAYGRP